MSIRIGVGISRDGVRAVAVDGREILWSDQVLRDPDQPLDEALQALLRPTLAVGPRRRWRNASVQVALGPASSQMKLLEGLPETDDPALLAKVVHEGRSSFFLASGEPFATGSVRIVVPGRAWAAAVNHAELTAVRDAFASLGLRKGLVLPAGVVLHHGTVNEGFVWSDGEIGLEVACDDAGPVTVRRRTHRGLDPEAPPLDPVPELAALEEDGARFADAYGAAVFDDEGWAAIGVAAVHPPDGSDLRRRLLWPSLVAAAAVLAGVLSPLHPALLAARAEAGLEALHAEEGWRSARPVLDRLAEITAVLTEIEAFASERREVAVLLAELARELPDGAALVSLEIEEGRGTISALAPDGSELLTAMRRWPTVTSVASTGPAARAVVAGRQVERTTVEFRLPGRDGAGTDGR